jgi:CRP/FNR family cyclic AMP-dependent transcriptional regulator
MAEFKTAGLRVTSGRLGQARPVLVRDAGRTWRPIPTDAASPRGRAGGRTAAVTVEQGSFIDRLDPELRRTLLSGARQRNVAPGALIFPPAPSWTRAGVVLDGVARGFLVAADGRQLTVRYVRPGDLIGSIYPLAGDRAPLAIQAVTACRVVELEPADLRELVLASPAFSEALLRVFARRIEDLYATLAASAFGTIRERLAALLLEIATPGDEAGRLTVTSTQQQLADGLGSVREVVARVLRELREDGIVVTTHGRIEILDPVRLAANVGRWRTRG